MAGKRNRRRKTAPSANLSGYVAVAVLILLIGGIIFVQSNSVKARLDGYNEQLEELQDGVSREEVRSEELDSLEKYANTKAYAAEQARLKLNLLGEDELIFIPEK